MACLFRCGDLEESRVDHCALMNKRGTDNLLSFITVIPAVTDRVKCIFFALENLFEESISLFPGSFLPFYLFYRQGIHYVALDQLRMEYLECLFSGNHIQTDDCSVHHDKEAILIGNKREVFQIAIHILLLCFHNALMAPVGAFTLLALACASISFQTAP